MISYDLECLILNNMVHKILINVVMTASHGIVYKSVSKSSGGYMGVLAKSNFWVLDMLGET